MEPIDWPSRGSILSRLIFGLYLVVFQHSLVDGVCVAISGIQIALEPGSTGRDFRLPR